MLIAAAMLGACGTIIGGETSPGASTRLPPVTRSAIANPSSEPNANLPDVKGPFVTPERLERGYTIVVVGVNGDNSLTAGLAPGLLEGGYPGAVEVVDWTTGHWPLFIYHLRAESRHRAGARSIAEKVTAYQARFPGREVNLVGYSAGAVVAVDAVEMLAAGQEIDRVVLLAGAISPLHDLRPALERTRVGMWSYYQPQDVVALWAGTLLAGTADGHHIVSAGAVGFWPPPKLSEAEQQLYREKLVQFPYQPQMVRSGNLGGHFQCVGRKFVAQWISPVLTEKPGTSGAQQRGKRFE
jgi:pimeloyl-ACP methyl ester carboxylesterase